MKPTTLPPLPNLSKLTLRQAMVLRGFDRIVDLVRRAAELKTPIPQPAVSAMLGGSTSYPKARAVMAALLGCTEDDVLGLIERSGREAARRLASTEK